MRKIHNTESVRFSILDIKNIIICLLIVDLSCQNAFGCEFYSFEPEDNMFGISFREGRCQYIDSWNLDDKNSHSGNYSMRSKNIKTGVISGFCREVSGPGYLSFWWMTNVDNLENGTLSFLIDHQERDTCTSNSWTKSTLYALEKNKTYLLEWRLTKKNSQNNWDGAGWIDDLCIFPQGETERCCPAQNQKRIIEMAGPRELNETPRDIYSTENCSNEPTSPGIMPTKNETTYVRSINSNSIAYCYPHIQQAIDNVTDGGNVRISEGVYREQITIKKSINVVGEGNNNTSIESDGEVVRVKKDNVSLTGLEIKGGDVGINVSEVENCSITGSHITGCGVAIRAYNSKNINISKNIVTNISDDGIDVLSTLHLVMSQNTIERINRIGIKLKDDEGSILQGNKIIKAVDGIKLISSKKGIVENNNEFYRISGCSIYVKYIDQCDVRYPEGCTNGSSPCQMCICKLC